jgi:hypothetical protein
MVPSGDESSEDGPTTAPASKQRRSSSGSAVSFPYAENEQGAISKLLREYLTQRKKDRENAALKPGTRRLNLEEKMMETEREDRILQREEKQAMIELLRSLSFKN